ncbi:hypothetical protein GA8_03640 [Geobacillus sp. A8]|nr:hypothetical protein GA8_03640 [Geobacillus sp. A8]
MEGTWWSLLPFLLIIPLAVWLKEILPGLVAGLLVGAFCLEWSAVGAIERAVSAVLHALTDPEHMKVAAFLYLFGSLVGMMQITGGIKGFVERLSGRIRSKRGILLFVWLTVPVTFFMPMFRIMLLGPVMKAVLRQFRIDRRRMAYMIDVSTEPIIVLLPAATAFVGFMTSVVAAALEQNDIHESPYDVFLRSLPYNLFAIVALAVGVLTTMLNIRIGKPRAKKGEGETNTLHGLGLRKELALINGEPLHLFVPLALLIALTFAFFVYDGRKRGAENWWEAFSAADATWAMLLALFVTILLSMMFYLWRRQSLSELTYHFFCRRKRADGADRHARSRMGGLGGGGGTRICGVRVVDVRHMAAGGIRASGRVFGRIVFIILYRFFMGNVGHFDAAWRHAFPCDRGAARGDSRRRVCERDVWRLCFAAWRYDDYNGSHYGYGLDELCEIQIAPLSPLRRRVACRIRSFAALGRLTADAPSALAGLFYLP